MPIFSQSASFLGALEYSGPYGSWIYGPGRPYILPKLQLEDQTVMTCVAEFPDGIDIAQIRNATSSGDHTFHAPDLWQGDGFEPRFVPFLIREVQRGALDFAAAISTLTNAYFKQRVEIDRMTRVPRGDDGGYSGHRETAPTAPYFRANLPLREDTFHPQFSAQAVPEPLPPDGGPAAPMVILGIIDDGIAVAHAGLRNACGKTRISACWHQGAPSAGGDDQPLFGRIVNRDEIDDLICRCDADEDRVYADLGLTSRPGAWPRPLDGAVTHGSHTLGLLAGQWPEATEDRVGIVAVDLPPTASWDTSGFGKDMMILSGLHFIFRKADEIARASGTGPLPLVINLSYGISGGPVDGSGMLEAAIDELVAARRALAPTIIVLPAGNSFSSDLHAEFRDDDFAGGGNQPGLHWLIQPGDRTSSFLEIWFPEGVDFRDYPVTVSFPDGTVAVEPTATRRPVQDSVFPVFAEGSDVFHHFAELHRGSRWRIVLAVAPTETDESALSPAPAGLWRISLARNNAARRLGRDGRIHVRVQRDEDFGFGRTGALQSFLVGETGTDPEATMPDPGPVQRFGSLNGMTGGAATLIVAGFDRLTGMPARYASAGGVAGPGNWQGIGTQVDCAAPSERSPLKPGIVAAGSRSGILAARSGTSVAAPQVARALAMALLAGEHPQGAGGSDDWLAMLGQAGIGGAVPAGSNGLDRIRLGRWMVD